MPVAHRRLRHLGDERLGVAQQEVKQRPPLVRQLLNVGGTQPEGLACTLHHGTIGGATSAHQERHAHHAFEADDRDLRRLPVLQHVQQGDDAIDGEENVSLHHPRLVEHLPETQRHQLQERLHSGHHLERDGIQQFVVCSGPTQRRRTRRQCHGRDLLPNFHDSATEIRRLCAGVPIAGTFFWGGLVRQRTVRDSLSG
ncbi:hypothetical protein D3C71_1256440 [compost metagenome]